MSHTRLGVKKPQMRQKAKKGGAVNRALELAEREKAKDEKKAARKNLRADARKQWN
jgi:hypothetical protein